MSSVFLTALDQGIRQLSFVFLTIGGPRSYPSFRVLYIF